MPRFTIKEFAEAIGIGTSREGVISAGIFLKTMSGRGLAPVVGKAHPPIGRPALVYDLDSKVAKSLRLKKSKRKAGEWLDIWGVMRLVNESREKNGSPYIPHHSFIWKLRKIQNEHKGDNNPYVATKLDGRKKLFSRKVANLIAKKIIPMSYKSVIEWGSVT